MVTESPVVLPVDLLDLQAPLAAVLLAVVKPADTTEEAEAAGAEPGVDRTEAGWLAAAVVASVAPCLADTAVPWVAMAARTDTSWAVESSQCKYMGTPAARYGAQTRLRCRMPSR